LRRRRSRVLLVLLVLAPSLFLLRAALWRPFAVAGAPPNDGFFRIPGVVHVHTTHSDGGGTPEEVARAAKAAGLSFVAITDHNNLDAKPFEGYRDGVLVIVGTEVSTTAGHLLALGIPDPVFRFSGDAADALEDVRELGGVSFAAHPLSPRADFRWSGWDLPGPWGIELINGDSQWREAGWIRLARTAALYGVKRDYALLGSLGSPASTLERWDALLARRNVPGLAGADAHGRLVLRKEAALRFPSYESLFGLVRNHVLLDAPLSANAASDARRIVEALAAGRCYVGLDALAPAGGFYFVVEGERRRWTMGDTVPTGASLKARAGGAVPRGARLALLRDGRAVASAEGSLEAPVSAAGVYRVEVRVPGWDVPWILSNPIYVFDGPAAAARAERAAWPNDSPVPPAAATIDDFEGQTTFAAEFDPSSSMSRDVLDPRGGKDGPGAARLEFRLGAAGPGRPYTWCALVSRQPRDLSGRQGLVFSIRGDGVYRIWVQVRDENPASADEGTEWWFASVRTSPEWRRVGLPFARLRSINKNTDGRLDLDKVRQIVFVLDEGAVKAGTKGTIRIDALGVY
jgi:hypothetical protein